jgi:ribose 5-phosphate isomerase A
MDEQGQAAAKRAAGYEAAERVKDGMVIGLGTGSTVFYAMERLKERIGSGLTIAGVPTSFQTAMRARGYGIPLTALDATPVLDLAIDGADQVDPAFRLIKGRGAAHVREKVVAAAAKTFIVVVDESKMTDQLSASVPVEVIPFAAPTVLATLRSMGGIPAIREGTKKDGPVISDNGNIILDCDFGRIQNPENLERALRCIPGVVDCGLFTGMTGKTQVIVGSKRGCRILTSPDIIP